MRQRSATLGIFAAMLAAVLFTGMDVFAKALGRMSSGELTFLRGAIGLLFLPFIARQEARPVFSGKDTMLLHLRGFTGGFSILLFFIALKGLTLGDAEILTELSAFFVYLLSPFFLKNNPGGHVALPLAVIAAGAACVMQVWNFSAFNGYAVIGILSAVFAAGAYICIGRLTEDPRRHSGGELVFYFQFYSMLGGAALIPFTGFVWPEGVEWLWVLGLSVTAITAQMAFTWGCQHVHSVIISFVMYTAILFHILAGWLFWGEVLTVWSWIGGAAIVGGSALLLWRTR